jgi:anaerobic magnesium-protoporphyrin IX monomethyl ester cyclase
MKNPMKDLCKVLDKVEPDLVGVSLRNIDPIPWPSGASYYEPFVSMIRLIKERAPSSKLVIGGTGFSIFPIEIMKRNPEIDYGVFSHGEVTIANLLKNLDHPERVKNIFFRRNERVVFTGREELTNFDYLHPPSRKSFDMSEYRKKSASMGVQSKRGCIFRCAYCLDPCLGGHRLQLRSPKKVVDEIEDLVNEYGIDQFFFADSVFNVPLKHAREICREIVKRKIDVKWSAYFREDYLDSKFMEEAVSAGCSIFDFMTGGACDEALRLLRRDLSIKDVEKSIDLISKMENAKASYTFLYDLPSGNLENLLGLTRIIGKILTKCGDKLMNLPLGRMRIYPNTLLHKIALSEGKIDEYTDLLPPVYYKSISSKVQTLPLRLAMGSLALRLRKKRRTKIPNYGNI